MKRSKTATILIIVIVVDLVLFSGYYFWFRHIEYQGKDISSISNKIDFLEKQETRLKNVKAVLEDTIKSRENIKSYLVSRDGVVGFVESLEKLGKSAGVLISIDSLGVESLKGQPASSTQFLALSISGSGNWQAVSRFVGMVETMPFVVVINSATLEKGLDEKTKKPLWNLNIRLSTLKEQ